MKRSILYLAAALMLSACTKPNTNPSENGKVEHIAVSALYYDEATSSSTTLGLIWDAEPLIEAGAQSFTLELIQDVETGKNPISRTVDVEAKVRKGSYIFTNLEKYSRHYARIRANYSEEESTAWAYVTAGGDPTPIEVGVGPVDRIETYLPPVARVIRATSGTVSVQWSMTGFEEVILDLNRKARAGIYSDAACTELIVSWDISKEFFNTDNKGGRYGGRYLERQPAFVFTGLEPTHDYWVRIDDITNSPAIVEGEVLKVTTPADENITVGTGPVAEGEYALREDFDELIWGGSMMDDAVGYSYTKRGSTTTLAKASGARGEHCSEAEADADGFFTVGENIEIGLFNTLKNVIPQTRLADWGYIGGGSSLMSGTIKIGGNKNPGKLVTPRLTNLSSTATVELSFDGEPYYIREPRTVQILVIRNTDNGSGSLVSPGTGNSRIAATFDLNGTYDMQHYTAELVNVNPGDRIAIGGTSVSNTDTNLRLLIDNVAVKVKAYETTEVPVDPMVAELCTSDGARGATSSTLTFHWKKNAKSTNAEDEAGAYKIYLYKDEACTDLHVSWVIQNGLDTNRPGNKTVNIANRFIFTGLAPNTDYYFVAEDLESGLKSPVVKATTLADPNVTIGADASAQAGDVLLYEDFGELLWTGDVVGSACGYTPYNRGQLLHAFTGDNPVGNQTIGGTTYNILISEPNDACGLFGTMKSSIPSTRLKNWGMWGQDGNNGRVTNRTGYVQVGNNNCAGMVVSPKMSSLSGTATVKVSFLGATGYPSDHLDMAIYVYRDAVTPDASTYVIAVEPVLVQKFVLSGGNSWQSFEAEVTGVTPASRIAIGGVKTDGKSQNRMMVDDIKVELVKYE